MGGLVRSAQRVVGAAGTVAGLASGTVQTAASAAVSVVHLSAAVAGAAVAATPAVVAAASPPRRVVTGVVTGSARRTSRIVTAAARTPVRAAATAADAALRSSPVQAVSRQAGWTARAVLDLHPSRTHRRVWEGHGHATIEVRGLTRTGSHPDDVATPVRRALSGLGGVRWAEVNAVTGQVLVAFDERRVDVGTLLDTVRAVEQAKGTRAEGFSWKLPVHPSDSTPVSAAALELAADGVAFATALVGRVVRVPALPRGVRVGLVLLDLQPQLRRRLVGRIGPVSTDVVMALTYAAVQGLSQRPVGPAVDAVHRTQLLAEALSRRSVWQRREPELCCTPETLPRQAPVGSPRPRPLPPGPLEAWTDELGPGSLLGGAAVLALTRDPRRAADSILAAAPRAARLGREAFAATAARQLAGRGVVPMDASAYRRLDRISAVVLDSGALRSDAVQVLAVEGEHRDERAVWDCAHRLLRGHTVVELEDGGVLADGGLRLARDPRAGATPPGAVRLVLRQGRRREGRVTVGGQLAPLAEAVVDAARESGARVLLSEDVAVAELVPRADEVLGADQPLAAHVRRLQEQGHGVLCVSATDDEALFAADVGVGVLRGGQRVAWTADLLCGPGLEDVWRLLRLAAEARPLSGRVVRLAQAASALGTLLALVGHRRRNGRTHALAPVHGAALLGLWTGTAAAHAVTRRRPPAPVAHVAWHALDAADVVERLDADEAPTAAEDVRWATAVARQLGAAGGAAAGLPVVRTVLAPVRATAALSRSVRSELHDPMTPVLAVGAASSAVVGSVVDAVLVAAVLTGNAVISGAQRLRAEQALRSLLVEQRISARRVRRDADARAAVRSACSQPDEAREALDSLPLETVPAPTLVPGDVIALRAAEVVPADARLLAAWDLEVDESSLTGESLPVDKDVEAAPAAGLTERTCMVFEGTSVLAGSAYAIVVAVGDATAAGRAARAAGAGAPAAGVQARLVEITRKALPGAALGGAAVSGLGLLRGLGLRQTIGAGVSVAVAAVPEGLPLVATVAQAGAARRLSRRGVLVRSSRTLEALGRVDTVCFDKTGTLTEGRLAVERVATAETDLSPSDPAAARILAVAARACPPVDDDGIAGVPHATDRAVLEAAADGATADGWELRAESSFETNRGYSASFGLRDGTAALAVKGSPEVVLPLCTAVDGDGGTWDDLRRRRAERTVQRLADAGLRVLAVAERRSGLPDGGCDVEPLVADLTLLGFVGIADSPRDSALEAVRHMTCAGIRPVMVTGDHPATAGAIARAVGLPADDIVTGAELEEMTEQDRVRRASTATVFARVSPEQKVRIVEALRDGGAVVAMIGDGANDAAAIRLADVGIGVGVGGSAPATSAADLVLSEPDLPRIYEALLEGRAMWLRMRDAVSILVGGNAGEVAFMLVGTALSGRAPINIRQMLLVNLLTDMFPALAVALAPGSSREDIAAPVGHALGAPLARAVVVRGSTTALGATLAWTIGRLTGRGRRADSMGLAALVGTQLGQTLLIGWRSPLVVTTALASAAVLFSVVETPGVSRFFGCTPVGPVAWVVVLGSVGVGTLAAALAPRLLPTPAAAPA